MKPITLNSQLWCCDNANWIGPVLGVYIPSDSDAGHFVVMQLIMPYAINDWAALHAAVETPKAWIDWNICGNDPFIDHGIDDGPP